MTDAVMVTEGTGRTRTAERGDGSDERQGERIPDEQAATGTAYERRAGEYLKEQGYELIGYNFRCRQGEIDIIARDGRYLVFVEVKYRRDGQTGDPLEAVDRAKQRRISRTAQYYCLTHGYGETTPCRFDVAAVLGTDGEVRLVKHAFEFQG